MTKRTTVAALAAIASLALAGTAHAAYSPRLEVQGSDQSVGGGGPLTIRVSTGREDDATARVAIYAPLGYRLTTGQPAGTKIGTVTARVIAKALGGALLPLTGDVIVDDPAKHVDNACAPGAHEAVWNLVLTAAGQTLTVPMYVDRTTSPENTFSSVRMIVCLPSPDVPQDQGGATFGSKLINAAFTVNVFSNPLTRGAYGFRSVWTPYAPGSGTTNPTGTVEARAQVRLPVQLLVSAHVNKRTGIVTIRGNLTENRVGLRGVRVRLMFGKTPRGVKTFRTLRTNAKGNIAATIRLRKGVTRYLRGFTALGVRNDPSGCAGTSLAPGGCVQATIQGFSVYSRGVVRLRR